MSECQARGKANEGTKSEREERLLKREAKSADKESTKKAAKQSTRAVSKKRKGLSHFLALIIHGELTWFSTQSERGEGREHSDAKIREEAKEEG